MSSTTERQIGLVHEVMCDNLEMAQLKAGAESANTSGHSIPVVIFQQGKRYNMTGALSFGFVMSRLETRSASARGSIKDVNLALNRPESAEHSDAIAKYLTDNANNTYILPPMTLNIQHPVRLYSVNYPGAQVRPGYLVIPATAKLAITDGQHRRTGINKAISGLEEDAQDRLLQDAIAVMITCESNIDQIHQDFADCSKTKPLAPSQVAVYDRRNPANRLVVDIERECSIFNGKVDATSTKIGKKSASLFTANQLRQYVKSMLVGSWAMGDADFEKRSKERLKTEEDYKLHLRRIVDYTNIVVDSCPVLHELAQLKTGVDMNRIPARRNEGWIVLTAMGLVVVGLIGHEIITKTADSWRDYARRVGSLEWDRNSPHWQGVLVNDGKLITSLSAVKRAVETTRQLINLPELGVPSATADDARSEPILA
jgi:DNA sulfur modification protein DndB